MPTNELIEYALNRIRRKAASGGTQQTVAKNPLSGIANKSALDAAAQGTPQTLQVLYGTAPGVSAMNPSGNGALFWDNWGGFTGLSGQVANDAALRGTAMPTATNNSPAPPPVSNTPAIPSGVVGNHGGSGSATGSPIGGVPNAQPNGAPASSTDNFAGPQYNNTLDQALGTNTPTMDQIFGFTYPTPPPPKPQPQGPVPQALINNLYGFGNGSQMGTGSEFFGSLASGGAIIMDAALNKARKAIKGNKKNV
jgi:hypothetical protein